VSLLLEGMARLAELTWVTCPACRQSLISSQ